MKAEAKSSLCVDVKFFTEQVTHSNRLHKCYMFAGWTNVTWLLDHNPACPVRSAPAVHL